MKVRLSKSSTGAILFALILCQFANGLQHINLAMCAETPDSVPHCIVHDSMGDKQYLHANATPSLLIKLPMPVLTEIWLDQSKIEIVTSSGMVINNGQEIIRSDDRDRWTIKFSFHPVNSDFGKLHLVLHIKDVDYCDTQFLHVEIKSMITIFQTTDKIWIPVEEKSNGGDNDHDGEAKTTENPVEREDPSAILHAIIGTLQNKTEVLEQKLTTTENVLSRYRMKYFRCLESKDTGNLNGTVKPEFDGKGEKVDITTYIMLLLGTVVVACVAFMLKGSRLVSSTGITVVNETHTSFDITDKNSSLLQEV